MGYRISNFRNLSVWVLICFVYFLPGCQNKADNKKVQGPVSIPVKVVRVQLRDIFQNLEYIGNIKAQDEVLVYPKVTGKIIEKCKEDGVNVAKGEAIVYIDRDEVGLKFQKAPVESPLEGVVGRIYVDVGTNVLPQTPIALVVNMDKVKINLDIPETYLPKVFLGQEAKIMVDAYPQEAFVGAVTKISPVVSLENRAAPIEITLDNKDHHLKSGMFARASLIIEKHNLVPVILKESIMGKEPDSYVYIIENNKAVIRTIKLGMHDGPYYEVREGIKEGDLVVVVGQQRLYDDAPVTPEIDNGNGQGDIR